MPQVKSNITVSKDDFLKFVHSIDPNVTIDFSQEFRMVHLNRSLVFQWKSDYVPGGDAKVKPKQTQQKQKSKAPRKLEPSSVKIGG